MPTFSYEARQTTGQTETGTLEGENAQVVARALQARGYFVVAIRPVAGKRAREGREFARSVLGPIFHPVNSKPLAIFFTSLRVLLATGMNLSQAMRVLSQQTSNPTLKRAAQEMSEEAARGRPMSSVLGRYPSAFNPTSAAVVEAGEASGMIELTADRLAKYYDRIFQLEQSYRWQTFYPKLLLAALILIPTAKTLFFGGLNAWLVLVLIRSLPLLVAVTLLWYGWRALRSIGPISEAIDAVKLYVPWFGSLARRMATARWARALEMLATAGVPVHQALVAAAAASGNKAMEASLVREAQGVLSGRSLLEVVAMSRAVPPLAVELLAAAEQTGSYEGVLEKIAEYYESETEVGGKQTAVVVGTGFYLIIALLIAIVVISFWRGYFASIGAYLK